MRDRLFLDRKAALARLLRNTKAGILFNEHIAEDGPSSSHTLPAWRRGHRFQEVDGTYRSGPCRVWIKALNPRQHRGAAEAKRDLEPMSPG